MKCGRRPRLALSSTSFLWPETVLGVRNEVRLTDTSNHFFPMSTPTKVVGFGFVFLRFIEMGSTDHLLAREVNLPNTLSISCCWSLAHCGSGQDPLLLRA